MASVIERRKDSWRCKFRYKNQSISQTFSNEADAIAFRNRIKTYVDRARADGLAIDLDSFKERQLTKQLETSMTIQQAFERYQREITPHKKSAKTEIGRIKKIVEEKGNIPLREFSPKMAKEFIDGLTSKKVKNGKTLFSATTKRNYAFLISHLYKVASRNIEKNGWGLQLENPIEQISLPKPNRTSIAKAITIKQEKDFFKKLKDMYNKSTSDMMLYAELKHFFELLFITGMRRKEVHSLTIENYDNETNTIILRDTKNNEDRFISLPETSKKLLIQLWIKKQNKQDKRFFTFNIDYATKIFKRLTGFRIHDIRGTVLTRLHSHGLPLKDIMNQSGHKTPGALLNRYLSLYRENTVSVLNKIDKQKQQSENDINSDILWEK